MGCSFPVSSTRKALSMNVPETIKIARLEDELVTAQLAVCFALLSQVPYDNWGHEGSPAEMAVLVVADAKDKGRGGFLRTAVLGNRYGR